MASLVPHCTPRIQPDVGRRRLTADDSPRPGGRRGTPRPDNAHEKIGRVEVALAALIDDAQIAVLSGPALTEEQADMVRSLLLARRPPSQPLRPDPGACPRRRGRPKAALLVAAYRPSDGRGGLADGGIVQ